MAFGELEGSLRRGWVTLPRVWGTTAAVNRAPACSITVADTRPPPFPSSLFSVWNMRVRYHCDNADRANLTMVSAPLSARPEVTTAEGWQKGVKRNLSSVLLIIAILLGAVGLFGSLVLAVAGALTTGQREGPASEAHNSTLPWQTWNLSSQS